MDKFYIDNQRCGVKLEEKKFKPCLIRLELKASNEIEFIGSSKDRIYFYRFNLPLRSPLLN